MVLHKKKIKNKIKKKISNQKSNQSKIEGEIVDKFDDDDFFDDCDICQFTKKMQNERREPTLLELKKVFDIANKKKK